jgi:hypothetical protein
MLAKLFRYECKALLRILPVLYLASLVLSAVVGLWVKEYDFFTIWMVMSSTAMFVITLVFVIQRFRNNFLKDEGYLMFTLPTSPWQLVASKALAALCAFVAACVVTALSVMILCVLNPNLWFFSGFSTILGFFRAILNVLESVYSINMLALAIVLPPFIVEQLFLIYACMTVSQLAPRFRGLIGFAVYLAIMLLVESLKNKLVYDALSVGMLKLWITALVEAVFAAVYFIASVKLLEHTFNLE